MPAVMTRREFEQHENFDWLSNEEFEELRDAVYADDDDEPDDE